MITEDELREATGLIARHYRSRKNGAPAKTLFEIERALLKLFVRIDNSVGAPDPHAPPGGSAIALRKVVNG